jgi:hypothetical protein
VGDRVATVGSRGGMLMLADWEPAATGSAIGPSIESGPSATALDRVFHTPASGIGPRTVTGELA